MLARTLRGMSTRAKMVGGAATATGEAAVKDGGEPKSTGLVMQIVVRRDLVTVSPGLALVRSWPVAQLTCGSHQTHNWPVGPLMAQAAHAASAVQHLHADHADMQRYLAGDDGRGWMGMRKTLLEVADEEALQRLHAALDNAGIPHHLWVEEP